MLGAILKSNEALLDKIEMTLPHPQLPTNFDRKMSLSRLAASAKDAENAWTIFAALWDELTAPGRPPLLFTLDGLSHIMRVSSYRDPSFKPIHSHDLAIVGLFVDYLSGARPLPNGGAAIAATSLGNCPRTPSLDLALARREAVSAKVEAEDGLQQRDPYGHCYDDRVEAALESVEVLRVGGVSKPHARALMEYWAASGVLRARIDEQSVSETWVLGGNGIIGEMERASLLNMRL